MDRVNLWDNLVWLKNCPSWEMTESEQEERRWWLDGEILVMEI